MPKNANFYKIIPLTYATWRIRNAETKHSINSINVVQNNQ